MTIDPQRNSDMYLPKSRPATRVARPESKAVVHGPEAVRVLCVDDHEMLVEGLLARFELDGRVNVVGHLASAEKLVEEVARLRPDVALLDIELPGPDIFEVADRLRAFERPPRIVFLTAHFGDGCLTAAYRCGASGYFSKSDRASEIVDGVVEIARGGGAKFMMGTKVRAGMIDPERIDRGGGDRARDADGPGGGAAGPSTALGCLTQREITILRLIGKGLSRNEIATELSRSVKTIDGHQERLMEKLGVTSRAELMRLAIREGLAAV